MERLKQVNLSGSDPSREMDHPVEIGIPRANHDHASEFGPEPVRILWLRLLWSERGFVLRAALCGVVLSLIAAFLLPVAYESQIRLMPPEQQSGSGLAMLAALAAKGDSSSESSSGGQMTGGSLARAATDVLGVKISGALLLDMLRGPTVQDSMVQKFDLRRRYHVRYWEDARKILDKHTAIKGDRKSGVVSIAVSDRDPYRAQRMSETYVEVVNTLLAQVSTSSARRERIFLEQRLRGAQESLDAAAQEFSAYASKTGALDVPSQTKSMVESEAGLQGQLVAAESELEALQQIYTDNNVRVRTLVPALLH